MKSFETTITIARSADAIWSVLTDATTYPEWAAGTHRLDGQIAEGSLLKLFTVSKPQQSMTLKVTKFVAPHTFTLSGGLPLGLFRGDRTFTLTPLSEAQTTFHMREVFTGPLSPILGRMIPDLTPSFEAYAAGLKQKCEG